MSRFVIPFNLEKKFLKLAGFELSVSSSWTALSPSVRGSVANLQSQGSRVRLQIVGQILLIGT
jgi:hypothetical protein